MRVRDARERVRDVLIRWHRGSRGGLQLCDDVKKKLVVQVFFVVRSNDGANSNQKEDSVQQWDLARLKTV